LCARWEWPRRGTAEQRDELAAFHRADPKSKDTATIAVTIVHRSKSGSLKSAWGQSRPAPPK
jgi:hypothetical protein